MTHTLQDTLWSALEDEQLIGRAWRFPQTKTVVVYRIIAHETSDVVLNNMAFSKMFIHHALMMKADTLGNISPSLSFIRSCQC